VLWVKAATVTKKIVGVFVRFVRHFEIVIGNVPRGQGRFVVVVCMFPCGLCEAAAERTWCFIFM
jgi:hypothetical protein